MYQIGTNPNAPLGGAWSPEQQPQAFSGSSTFTSPGRGDGVAPGYFSFSGGGGSFGAASEGSTGGGWLSSGSSGLGGVMSSFYNAIQNVFAQISSSLNGTSSTGSTTGTAANCTSPGSSQSGSCGAGGQEQGYTSASASSWGDPHLTFNGTTASGSSQNGAWMDTNSHADLLDSDSFAGGVRISTTATTPNSAGIAYNQSATIATDNGQTNVSFNQAGLQVTQNGQSVSVAKGQSVDLGNGEIVSEGTDGNATVVQSNASGGSLSTTLKENGEGVDVATTATNVDLGGYLVSGRDSTPVATGGPYRTGPYPSEPVGYAAAYGASGQLAGGSWNESGSGSTWNEPNYGSWSGASQTAQTSPYQLAGFSEPSIDDEFV